jgi:hypothetical protein
VEKIGSHEFKHLILLYLKDYTFLKGRKNRVKKVKSACQIQEKNA